MARKKRCLMIGAGGFARHWIRNVFPNFRDRMKVLALVDINPEALKDSGDFLDLPKSSRFSDMQAAFEKVEAEFCAIVIPPACHRDAVLLAVEKNMPILSEKPIADSWEASVEIYRAVSKAALKMAVIQNYRYTSRILTLKSVLRGERLGRLNYLVARFAADYRRRNAWGEFRHEIPHSLLVEGSVHHFDQIRNLTDSDCTLISGWEWNPDHPSFDGQCCALYLMLMERGTRAHYEGNCLEAGWQNSWHREFYRAECENGAVVLDNDGTVRTIEHKPGRGLRIEEVAPIEPEHDGHNWILDEFLGWLEGGPAPRTVISDNIKSTAMLFAAVRASASNTVVDVRKMLPA